MSGNPTHSLPTPVRSRPFLVFAAGLLAVLLFLEAGLRLLGWLYLTRLPPPRLAGGNDRPAVILCLGDSHTYGIGARRGQDYPSQLEIKLRDRGRKIQVINTGMPGNTTDKMLVSLRQQLRQYRPTMVILLIGGTNRWILDGFNQFVRGDTFTARCLDALQRVRVYRLGVLLLHNMAERFETRDALPESTFSPEPSPAPEPEPPGPGAKERAAAAPQKKPLDLDDPGIDEIFRKNMPDADTLRLQRMGMEFHYRGQNEKAIECFRQVALRYPNVFENYNFWFECLLSLNRPDEAAALFEQCIVRQPHLPQFYDQLTQLYQRIGEPDKAIDTAVRCVRATSWDSKGLDLLFFIFRKNTDPAVRDRTMAAVKALIPLFPQAEPYFQSMQRLREKDVVPVLRDWIAHDVDLIIRTCLDNGVPVLMQDYAYADVFSDLFQSLARKYHLPFVSQCASFKQISPDERRLFFSVDNHCNARGYERMAENLCQAILAGNLLHADSRDP